ncbi:hypothetical protein ONE63_008048 [Megalurothrips usitatus]|uniref:HAT C-terminal dimerisation domain-containing protein n=1 Tax=Megalurothrips usitatus TaxID=439358 RepID=A0AAV7XQH6_9NEOP|nr:hypothetical protein ONE63_008048 [Megalurothrips usitatus]
MAKPARRLFAVPATSAESERVFSDTGFIISDRRTRLAAETVACIVFMHDVLQKRQRVDTT